MTGRIVAIGTIDFGPVRAGGNLGILIRETSNSFATDLGPQLLYGAAADYSIDKKTNLILELAGRSGLDQFASFYNDVNPFEVDVAGRRTIKGMWSVTAGVGRGLGNGVGAPDLRLFAMAAFNPDFRDRDHDGIYDIDDKCPDQPEDRDGFQDDDGCPDPDNDNDGIPDVRDKCPNDAEDVDSVSGRGRLPRSRQRQGRHPRPQRRLPERARGPQGQAPQRRLPVDHRGQRRRRHPRRRRQVPRRARGQGRLRGRRRLPRSRQRRRRHPRQLRQVPERAPRTTTASRTRTAAPIPTTTRTASPTPIDKCPIQPETLNGIKDDDGCPDPGPEMGPARPRGRSRSTRSSASSATAARSRCATPPPRW